MIDRLIPPEPRRERFTRPGLRLTHRNCDLPASCATGSRSRFAPTVGLHVVEPFRLLRAGFIATKRDRLPPGRTAPGSAPPTARRWPEPPRRAPGIPGTLATIKRPDGTTQVTRQRARVYPNAGDIFLGRTFGNGLNLNGGLWHEMTAPG